MSSSKAPKTRSSKGPKSMRPYTEAMAFARSLKLPSRAAWEEWSSSTMRPADIPANPHKAYRGDPLVQFRWANFLGYRVGSRGLRRDFLSFFEARKIVRKLELKTQTQFQKWAKSENRPANIPANPDRVYATNGWVSTSDWLGTTTLPFLEARAFARTLKLKGKKEWVGWKKSGKRPSNIPSNPDQAYRDTGWDSMQDWLGYGPWGGECQSCTPSGSGKVVGHRGPHLKGKGTVTEGSSDGGASSIHSQAPFGGQCLAFSQAMKGLAGALALLSGAPPALPPAPIPSAGVVGEAGAEAPKKKKKRKKESKQRKRAKRAKREKKVGEPPAQRNAIGGGSAPKRGIV